MELEVLCSSQRGGTIFIKAYPQTIRQAGSHASTPRRGVDVAQDLLGPITAHRMSQKDFTANSGEEHAMMDVKLTESHFPAIEEGDIVSTTIGDLLRDAAADTPESVALVECDINCELGRSWTYAELLSDAERLGHALASRFEPGERVALWSPNTPEWAIMEFACSFAGLTLVTVNPAYQPNELEYVLNQSQSSGLFLVEEYRGNPMAKIAQEVCAGLPKVKEVVNLDDEATLYRVEGDGRPLPKVLPDDAVQIQYTSGTTGFPKGALLSHKGLVNNARLTAERMTVRKGQIWMNYMPMFHTAGCALAMLGSVQFRCTLYMVKLFDPGKIIRLIESKKVNVMVGVPTMLIGLLEAAKGGHYDFSSVEVSGSGGSMVPPELVRQIGEVFDCNFSTVFGQTETSPVITQTRPSDSFADLCETIGQPLPHTEISIRDPKSNTVVPFDTVGEICSRGYCNMIGYNDNPKATAETIDTEGWLHTGDLGTMDERGFVKITGRVKEMIIRGGENLFPAEIENVLIEHTNVAEVAVVGVPDAKWGEIAICFIRPNDPSLLSKDELVAHCRSHLAAQKTPSQWFAVQDFPLTGSGKIRKFKLRDSFVDGEFDGKAL